MNSSQSSLRGSKRESSTDSKDLSIKNKILRKDNKNRTVCDGVKYTK